MQTIDRDTLRQWQEQNRDFALVEVLAPDKYREFHLPGAINVPLGENFETRIQQAIPEPSTPVVVYCYDLKCSASPQAAKKMDGLGYRKVFDYEAGKMDWKEAGLPVE